MSTLNYTNSLVLSGNGGTLIYNLTNGNDLYVAKRNDTGSTYLLHAITDGKDHEMDMSEVLEAIPLETPEPGTENISSFTPEEWRVEARYTGRVSANTDYFSVIRGRDRRADYLSSQYLLNGLLHSARRKRHTTVNAREYLSILCNGSLTVTVGTQDENLVKPPITLLEHKSTDATCISTIRCDCKAMTELFEGDFSVYQIRNWEIKVTKSISSNGRIRVFTNIIHFELTPKRPGGCFVYLNDLGGLETVNALGGKKAVPEYEPQAFLNGGKLQTVTMGATTQYEAGSGPFDTSADAEAWLEFLRSDKRWLLLERDGSQALVPIHVTEASPEIVAGQLNELSFKFRTEKELGILP